MPIAYALTWRIASQLMFMPPSGNLIDDTDVDSDAQEIEALLHALSLLVVGFVGVCQLSKVAAPNVPYCYIALLGLVAFLSPITQA